MMGIMGRLKWFIIGLLIGALVTYIFTSERLSGVRDKVKELLSLGMGVGVAYAEEMNPPGEGSLSQETNLYYPQHSPVGRYTIYTGLIIDARGLGLKPAMDPKVLSESGASVYGMDRRIMEDKKFIIKQGLVAYVRTMEKAKELKRIGKNPFVVRATGVSGQFKTDVVIGEEQAKAILKLKGLLTFWEQCRVAIVLD